MIEGTWYLAHPLKGDERFSYDDNMRHLVRVMRILFHCGLVTVAPYHTHCLFLDNENKEHRDAGLRADTDVVRGLKKLVLVGHKISGGMIEELDALPQDGMLINLVGVPDNRLWSFIPRRLV